MIMFLMLKKVTPLFLLLFFLSSPMIQSMEVNNPTSSQKNILLRINELKQKRTILKSKLEHKNYSFWMWNPKDNAFHSIYTAKNKVNLTKIVHCYNPKRHIHGYSALGITILSPHISFQEKSEIIQIMYPFGFTPTSNDTELAFLEWWERIPFDKIMLLYCAIRKNPESILCTLPDDLFMFLMTNLEKPLL